MPYNSTSELPDAVKDNLPSHAEEIFKEAYNSAWDQYKKAQDREGDKTREETAHAVAWSAVKNEYHKDDEGKWVKD